VHVPDQDGMSIERRVAKDKAVSGDKLRPGSKLTVPIIPRAAHPPALYE